MYTKNNTQSAYNHLKDLIIDRHLASGQRLDENMLVDYFNISLQPTDLPGMTTGAKQK